MKNVKEISIKSFLEAREVRPTIDKGYYGLYHSPVRQDATPSFKVDYERNLWVDYGTGDGGSIIDLIMALERCDKRTAIKFLEGDANLIRVPEFNHSKPQRSNLTITHVKPLEHPALVRYMEGRGISLELVSKYCSEIHYQAGGKNYFAVGFLNNAGGWELRNAYYKGGTSPKYTTTISAMSNQVAVFEGFMDFMSYLSLNKELIPTVDVVILNSVANLRKALPFLRAHGVIYTYLDNDEAGRCATEEINRLLPGTLMVDESRIYADHKDLNEYLMMKLKR